MTQGGALSDALERAPEILTPEGCGRPEDVGGKAATLSLLLARGFEVPAFVCLPKGALEAVTAPVDVTRLKTALSAAGVRAPYAVRSSGIVEDGALHSHAGQFETFLGVLDEELPGALAAMRDSQDNARLEAYRTLRGVEAAGLAIVVQTMLRPSVAGVLFTADPVSGRRDVHVVTAVRGLADRLVAGEESGETYRIDAASGFVLDAPETREPLVDGALAMRLSELGRAVEEALGRPQDIEWAVEEGRLFVLQARPITTLDALARPLDDTERTILDNSNIVESYPGIVSPLTYSFTAMAYARVYRTLLRLLAVPEHVIVENAVRLDNLVARIEGRLYYNLANLYRVLSLLPGFSDSRRAMELMMGVETPLPEEWLAGFARYRPVSRAKNLFALLRLAVAFPRMRKDFLARVEHALGSADKSLETMPLSELVSEYRRIEAALVEKWDAPVVNDLLCMLAFHLSRRVLGRLAGDEGLAYHDTSVVGRGDVASAEPARRIAEMAALVRRASGSRRLTERLGRGDVSVLAEEPWLAAEVRAYVERFGDRCIDELKLEATPLSDDCAPLLRAVAGIARTSERPHEETRTPQPCEPAWKKDPVFGVIGVQSGPP